MADRITFFTQGGQWNTDRRTWAEDIETWAGDTGYIEQAPGPDGPTYFIRLGTERLTPRAAGDLIIDPNVAAIDWDTGWLYPTFQNGWVNYGGTFTPARYRKSAGNMVYIDGLIKSGTMNATAFQLATGYRSTHRIIMSTMSVDNAANNRIDIINGTGQVNPISGANGWVSILLMFFAEL